VATSRPDHLQELLLVPLAVVFVICWADQQPADRDPVGRWASAVTALVGALVA